MEKREGERKEKERINFDLTMPKKSQASSNADDFKEETLKRNQWYITRATKRQYEKISKDLTSFWTKQPQEIAALCNSKEDFKGHNDFPLARIKRIMKSDEDVRMIRAEAPILLAKACELFIMELTVRSLGYSKNSVERCQLLRADISKAIYNTATLDFLVDCLEEMDRKGEKGGKTKGKK